MELPVSTITQLTGDHPIGRWLFCAGVFVFFSLLSWLYKHKAVSVIFETCKTAARQRMGGSAARTVPTDLLPAVCDWSHPSRCGTCRCRRACSPRCGSSSRRRFGWSLSRCSAGGLRHRGHRADLSFSLFGRGGGGAPDAAAQPEGALCHLLRPRNARGTWLSGQQPDRRARPWRSDRLPRGRRTPPPTCFPGWYYAG